MSPRPESDYFSIGFRNFLETIRPYQVDQEASFPRNYAVEHIAANEEIFAWFHRIIDEQLGGLVDACAIEEDLGVFAKIHYHRGHIAYANIQVIKTAEDLETFYLDARVPCNYLRLDYDPNRPGKIFTHPLPHIHASQLEAPRFGSDISESGNIIVDFFDFIYRNFYDAKWIEWVRHAYREGNWHRAVEADDFFEPIRIAFEEGRIGDLRPGHRREIGNIRQSCRKLKNAISPGIVDHQEALLIAY